MRQLFYNGGSSRMASLPTDRYAALRTGITLLKWLIHFMAIPVTCPSCLTRFNVSDKFAGKSGPCPKCQKTIKIPEKSDEVVIHAPEDAAPKDSKGRSVLKPLRRTEVSISLPIALAAGLGTLVVFGIAFGLGLSGRPPSALLGIAAGLLALPLSFVGYWFLHDDELEGFSGRQLMIRCGLGAVAFAATWAIYAFVPAYLFEQRSMAEISGLQMVVFISIMIVVGTVASVLIFELELLQGVLHYMFYFTVTFLLAWLAGAQLAEPLSNGDDVERAPSVITAPKANEAPTPPTPAAPPTQERERKIPSLLQ